MGFSKWVTTEMQLSWDFYDRFPSLLWKDINIFFFVQLWDIRGGYCLQTFTGHESDINSIVVSQKHFLIISTAEIYPEHFSFSPMVTHLPPEVTMPHAGCSTSGLTRSWPCTATITSSVASRASPSARVAASSWPDMMTLTATFGTHWGLREQVWDET